MVFLSQIISLNSHWMLESPLHFACLNRVMVLKRFEQIILRRSPNLRTWLSIESFALFSLDCILWAICGLTMSLNKMSLRWRRQRSNCTRPLNSFCILVNCSTSGWDRFDLNKMRKFNFREQKPMQSVRWPDYSRRYLQYGLANNCHFSILCIIHK